MSYGSTSAPSSVTTYLDALFATTLANYNKTLTDQISKTNALLDVIMSEGNYESVNGGAYIAEPLMYGLSSADWYDGADTLSTEPTDGITQAIFDWRQLAVPITYSMKEVKQNKQRIVSLVKTKIRQAELGIHEKLNQAILQGAGSGSLATAQTSGTTGASGVDPLPLLVHYAPTSVVTVGNIPQGTYSWWRNQQAASTATTLTGLLQEMDHMYNNCSKGPGGPPKLIMTDQTSYELFQQAMYLKWNKVENNKNFNFENTQFKRAVVTWDECVPNVYAGTTDTTTATGGTMYFLNTQYFKLKYESETNFVMGPFQKPVDQDTRLAHILWMGNLVCNNRRKQGVLGAIARTLTAS